MRERPYLYRTLPDPLPEQPEDALDHPVFKLAHAIEVVNGGTSDAENDFAMKVAGLLKMPAQHAPEGVSRNYKVQILGFRAKFSALGTPGFQADAGPKQSTITFGHNQPGRPYPQCSNQPTIFGATPLVNLPLPPSHPPFVSRNSPVLSAKAVVLGTGGH